MDSEGTLEKCIFNKPVENKPGAVSEQKGQNPAEDRGDNPRGSAVPGTPFLQRDLKRDSRKAWRNPSSSLPAASSCPKTTSLFYPPSVQPQGCSSRTPGSAGSPCPEPLVPSLGGAGPGGKAPLAFSLWAYFLDNFIL